MSFLRGDDPIGSEEVARVQTIVDCSPHFSREELQCPCCGACEVSYGSLQKLEQLRRGLAQPFRPNSAYRCQKHNDELPDSKPDSAHVKGHAFDIPVRNGFERWKVVWCAIDAGFTRIGVAKTFIHVDDDPTLPQPVIWTY